MVQPLIGPIEQQPAEMRGFYQAWKDVIRSIEQLQQTSAQTRESLDRMAPELASDPGGWRVLDQFLYFERLAVELGRIADDARRGTDELASGTE